MHVNRGLVFWGVALVTAGVVALAVQQKYLDRDALAGAWRLWPIILIALGISIVLARTPFAVLGTIAAAVVLGVAGGALITVGPGFASCGGADPTSLTTREGTFNGSTASVDLRFNCGTLEVGLADGDGWSLRAGQRGGEDARIEAAGNSLSVRSADQNFVGGGGKQRWNVALGSELTYSLSIDVNAADTLLNLAGGTFSKLSLDPNAGSIALALAGASVEDLRLSLNAGSASVTVDADSAVTGQLSANAGSMELCTAPETALRIAIGDNITFSHNLDESELNQSGDTWVTEGFGDAPRKVDLRVGGNAASFTLNPEDGCS
jgi:hypothetical protein